MSTEFKAKRRLNQSSQRDIFVNDDARFDALSTEAERGTFAYLATPYTKYADGIDEAAIKAAAYAAQLIENGLCTLSPIAHGHAIAKAGDIDPLDVDFWLSANQGLLDAASVLIVVMMDGWLDSKGVAAEVDFFVKEGRRVIFLQESFFQAPEVSL